MCERARDQSTAGAVKKVRQTEIRVREIRANNHRDKRRFRAPVGLIMDAKGGVMTLSSDAGNDVIKPDMSKSAHLVTFCLTATTAATDEPPCTGQQLDVDVVFTVGQSSGVHIVGGAGSSLVMAAVGERVT